MFKKIVNLPLTFMVLASHIEFEGKAPFSSLQTIEMLEIKNSI